MNGKPFGAGLYRTTSGMILLDFGGEYSWVGSSAADAYKQSVTLMELAQPSWPENDHSFISRQTVLPGGIEVRANRKNGMVETIMPKPTAVIAFTREALMAYARRLRWASEELGYRPIKLKTMFGESYIHSNEHNPNPRQQ